MAQKDETPYKYHPDFDNPLLHTKILSEPEWVSNLRRILPQSPDLASVGAMPLLDGEQEAFLFKKMNFLKYLVFHKTDLKDKVKKDYEKQAFDCENIICACNYKLVFAALKKTGSGGDDLKKSAGFFALLKSVKKFDFSRGIKFSTYATWAIFRSFQSVYQESQRTKNCFVSFVDELFLDKKMCLESVGENKKENEEHAKYVIGYIIKACDLNPRDREVMEERFGKGETLEAIGDKIGLTKERIRQITGGTMRKFKKRVNLDSKLRKLMYGK